MTVETPLNSPTTYETGPARANFSVELRLVRAARAYERGYFGQGVTVAVLDTGVAGHQAFEDGTETNLVDGYRISGYELNGSPLADPKDMDDSPVQGRDPLVSQFMPRTPGSPPDLSDDPDGHGTAVAGVIAALTSDVSVHGIAPLAKIMPLKFWHYDDPASSKYLEPYFDFPEAMLLMEEALKGGVPIINNSWGQEPYPLTVNFGGKEVEWLVANSPRVVPGDFPSLDYPVKGFLEEWREIAVSLSTAVGDYDDFTMVFSAGNGAWNSESGCVRRRMDDDPADDVPAIVRCARVDSDGNIVDPIIDSDTGKFVRDEYDRVTYPEGVSLIGLEEFAAGASFGSEVTVNGSVHPAGLALSMLDIGSFNEPNGIGYLPWLEDSLLGKMLAVAATDDSGDIVWFSDGCGSAKHWCLAAPGLGVPAPSAVLVTTTVTETAGVTETTTVTLAVDDEYYAPSGTSFAAPMVSGALAVMRSRFTSIPMSVIVAIMLSTADDAGERGLDEVYGHGVLNLGRAITSQGRVSIPTDPDLGTPPKPMLLSSTGMSMAPALAGLGAKMSGMSVAVGFLGGYYYEMPLSDLIGEAEEFDPGLGLAAWGLLIEIEDRGQAEGFSLGRTASGDVGSVRLRHGRAALEYSLCGDCDAPMRERFSMDGDSAPFFAESERRLGGSWEVVQGLRAFTTSGLDEGNNPDGHTEYGLRWDSGSIFEQWRIGAGLIGIRERPGFLLGSELSGALGVEGALTRQLDLRIERHAGGWRLFAAAERGWTGAEGMQAAAVSGADAAYMGWRLGAEGSSLLRGGDRLLLGVTGHPRVTGGEMVLLLPVITDSTVFHEDLQMNLHDEVAFEEHRLDLSGSSVVSFGVGYAAPLGGRGIRFGAGLEHASGELIQDETALSFELAWDL